MDENINAMSEEDVKYLYSFDDEQSMREQERFILIEKEDKKEEGDDIEKYFFELPEYDQKMIIHIISILVDNREFFGFNLEQVLKAYKDTESKVTQTCVAYMMGEYYKDVFPQYRDSAYEEKEGGTLQEKFKKELQKLYRTCNPRLVDRKKGLNLRLIEFMCVCMGIDMNVLVEGRGEHYILPVGISADDLFEAWKEVDRECNSKIESNEKAQMEYINVRSVYDKCGIDYEVKYSVVKYSGCYLLLNQQKNRSKKMAVDQLIKDLYRKKKYEEVQKAMGVSLRFRY